ncbi:MAG: PTS system mannose/fructose/sorbose family transporter subunit IID [Desulfurococcus sp.]|nr:PTS system mannose/fructose/sorbose family transporter subunit IID [Desulfurococcus sp.]
MNPSLREGYWQQPLLIVLTLLVAIALSPISAATTGSEATLITPGQLIAIVVLVVIAVFEFLGYRPIGIGEPLTIGTLTGIIVGLPLPTALALSALLELVYLGVYPIGGAAAPDALVATVIAVLFAKILGYTTIAAEQLSSLVALAVPIGILSMYVEVVLARAGCTIYAHLADAVIERGNVDRLYPIVAAGTFQWAISKAIPILVVGALGLSPSAVEAIRAFVNNPDVARVMGALGVAGAMMPAVGLAYLMKLMFNKMMIPWFLLGYILAAYFNMPILGIALMLVALLFAIKADEVKSLLESLAATGGEAETVKKRMLSRKDLVALWLKIAFTSQWAWNYERMQGQAYAAIIKSIEKKLRKSKEELINWMKVHNEFFNTNPAMIPFIMGLNVSLEEEGADADTIRSLKTMLMGPLAGLGDGLFWFTWRPIVYGLGASLALAGSLLGPLLATVLWAVPIILVTWWFLVVGYRYGERAISLIQGGQLEVVRELGTILAMGIIGALGVMYINIHTPVTIAVGGGQAFVLQDALDKILPRLIPLLTLLGTYWLYMKGLTPGKILIIVFLTGFILGLAGLLAV